MTEKGVTLEFPVDQAPRPNGAYEQSKDLEPGLATGDPADPMAVSWEKTWESEEGTGEEWLGRIGF